MNLDRNIVANSKRIIDGTSYLTTRGIKSTNINALCSIDIEARRIVHLPPNPGLSKRSHTRQRFNSPELNRGLTAKPRALPC